MNEGESKFKMLPQDQYGALLNEIVSIRAEISILAEIILSDQSATTKTPFKTLAEKFQSTLLKKRAEILSKLFESYGHLGIDDILNDE